MVEGMLGKHTTGMLTVVTSKMQPQLNQTGLTLVYMERLNQRIAEAARLSGASRTAMAKACGTSAAAVSKWFSGDSKEIKVAHVFALADMCQVDAKWLAIGEGSPRPNKGPKGSDTLPHSEFEPKHRDLLRMYLRLPPEVRAPIRQMIETMSAAQREKYHSWSRKAELATTQK